MFGLNENTQYYVCQRYVRMNTGINGLYQIVRTEMELPPLGGAVFIFFSKNRQQVKLLKWDGDGFLLYHKRLERGTFELPFFDPKNKQCKMPHKTLSAIMSGKKTYFFAFYENYLFLKFPCLLVLVFRAK